MTALFRLQINNFIQVKKLPTEYNKIKLVNNGKDHEIEFIDLKQLENIDLDWIRVKIDYIFRKEYGEGKYEWRITPVFKFLKQAKDIQEDVFFFEA